MLRYDRIAHNGVALRSCWIGPVRQVAGPENAAIQNLAAGLEQRKLKVLETKVLLGHSPGFIPSIKKVIIWDLLDQ